MPRVKQVIPQLPIPSRESYKAILNARYLEDIPSTLQSWNSNRIILVHSTALDKNTSVIKDLKSKLGPKLVASKSGVGSHSPYSDVIDIARLLQENDADCLISIGSSSYSDACKIARLLHATLPPGFSADDVEALVDQDKGLAHNLSPPKIKLILVPTSLSASEWNATSSATNPARKKQHFGIEEGCADLVLCDPEVASTSPERLWLSSGVRAVDHCVETMCNPTCPEEASQNMEKALATLLRGLKEYKEGAKDGNKEELLDGISESQAGSRQAMLGILIWRIPMGASHAIGHQLGSVAGVMHGVTSCIMLAPVLRYMKSRGEQIEPQKRVLKVFNETLGWQEKEAADAMARLVSFLELPGSLKEAGVSEEQIDQVAEKTLTDIWGGGKKQLETKQDVLEVLDLARE